MKQYFLNKNEQPNGDHEVHTDDCHFVPLVHNRIDLGSHSSCRTAVLKAKSNTSYQRINGCKFCSLHCHTS